MMSNDRRFDLKMELRKKLERSHYKWLDRNLWQFFKKIGIPQDGNAGIISAHGDKGYQYREAWKAAGIPFEHGMAVFLASYCRPYSDEVRQTSSGWVNTDSWVVEKYGEWRELLNPSWDELDGRQDG